jgi:non-histone protein 10
VLIITEKLTPIASQPNEKPLRTKRGHRKPSFLANLDSAPSFVSQGLGGAATLSPSGSDAFSMTHPEAVPSVRASNANRQLASMGNGHLPATTIDPLSKPKSAFDVYCRDLRDVLIVQNRKAFNEGNWDPDRALAQGWRDMDEGRRGDFQTRYEEMRKAEKEAVKGDEDVEMGDGGDETEVAEETGGFTAVNQ